MFKQLKELILLEEFKNCLSEKIVVYLNEQKVSSLSEAAIFSDEFELTKFSPVKRNVPSRVCTVKDTAVVHKKMGSVDSKESRKCYYCHEVGHLISNCPTLKRQTSRGSSSESVALVERSVLPLEQNESINSSIGSTFEPFIYDGVVSLSETSSETV